MAELQQRARAFDLAIENIYMRMRRVLARHAVLITTARDLRYASRREDDRREQVGNADARL